MKNVATVFQLIYGLIKDKMWCLQPPVSTTAHSKNATHIILPHQSAWNLAVSRVTVEGLHPPGNYVSGKSFKTHPANRPLRGKECD